MAEKIELEKRNFWNFRRPVTLTLDRVIRHTIVHQSSISIYTPVSLKSEKLFVDGCTDGWTFPPLILLGRLGGVDLIIILILLLSYKTLTSPTAFVFCFICHTSAYHIHDTDQTVLIGTTRISTSGRSNLP